MIIQELPRLFKAHGESLQDVVQWLKSTSPRWSNPSSIVTGRDDNWDFGVGYAGALELADKGWPEGVRLLADSLSVLAPPNASEDSWRYDVAGELPDIGRFLAGDPAHMRRHGHPKGHQPILALAIPIVVAAAVSAKELANYGAAIVSLVDRLEASGRRVEVRATHIGDVRPGIVAVSFTAKQAQDPVDLSALAFSLGHPAASRRITFAMIERAPHVGNTGWYGMPIKETEEHLVDPIPGTIVMQRMVPGSCRTPAAAMRTVVANFNMAAGAELAVELDS